MNGYRIRRAILLRMYPEARDCVWFKQLDAHQARMANDAEVQRRRAVVRKQARRDLLRCIGAAAALLLPLAYWVTPMFLSFFIEAY